LNHERQPFRVSLANLNCVFVEIIRSVDVLPAADIAAPAITPTAAADSVLRDRLWPKKKGGTLSDTALLKF
jgi:hypothetical protein